MKKIQVIKEILGNKIKPYGFKYGGYTHNRWTFKRIVNNVEQEIVLVKDLYCEELRIQISTSEQGIPLEIRDITEDERYRDKFSWKYSNEEEYIQVLQELSNLVVKYCISKFDEISISLFRNKPTEEMYYKLYSEKEELVKWFVTKFNILDLKTDEVFNRIYKILEQYKSVEFCEIEEMLLAVSAIYGNKLIERFGGQWTWNKHFKICSIENMSGSIDYCNVLTLVIYNWEKGTAIKLLEEYNEKSNLYGE